MAVGGASGTTAFLPPSPAWDEALMVSDTRIGRTVVIGETGRLWAWNGTTWQPLASGRGPQAGAAAVYDPALGDLVVFGTVTRTERPPARPGCGT